MIHESLESMGKFSGGHGRKCVWPLSSHNSKIGYISVMN